MPNKNNQAIADPDIRDSGVVVVDSKQPLEGGSRKATAEELALALEASERRNAQLEAQLTANQSAGSDSIQALAAAISQLTQRATVSAVPESDNLNRTTDFKNQRATVDGQNMVEAQQALSQFRSEERKPISVPKTMANQIGAVLSISVNGVQVRIPCDGKTYYINKTHWEHARERLAKLDIRSANVEPQVLEIS